MPYTNKGIGWNLENLTTTMKWYDGLPHPSNIPREIKEEDLQEGLLDDKDLYTDMISGFVSLFHTSDPTISYTSTKGLDLLQSLKGLDRVNSIYTFSRRGEVFSRTWLKVGEVPSNDTPHTLNHDVSLMRISFNNESYLDTHTLPTDLCEVTLYEKTGDLTFRVLSSLIISNGNKANERAFTEVSLPLGSEISAKITRGSCLNPVVSIEVR